MGYINRKSCCCDIAIPGRMIGYVKEKSCCCHIAVLGGMLGYVNRRSYCCHNAVPSKVLKSGKRAQLTEYRIMKGRLISW